MFMQLSRYIFLFFLIFYFSIASANQNISLVLRDVNLNDAIRMLAKTLKINVIVSDTVKGMANLDVENADAEAIFSLLLASHELVKWQIANVWYIGPRDALIKYQQEELKWQGIQEDTLPLITQIWRIHYGLASDIAHVLMSNPHSFLSKRGQVKVDTRTNTLCIQDTAERMKLIFHLVKQLDVPVKQILIKARIVSVDDDFQRELGLHFAVNPAQQQSVLSAAQLNSQDVLLAKAATMGSYSLAVAKLADGSLLDVKLAALEKAGHAELISRPSLFTANQQTASIEAGEEVPYQEISESGGTAIAFKKAVLGLKVTPQVLPGNKVLLKLQVNQDRPSHRMVQGMPTISTRQVISNVVLKLGETIVLGGIYESNREQGQERVPFISQIPVLGWLFRQDNTQEAKRELLIFITLLSL